MIRSNRMQVTVVESNVTEVNNNQLERSGEVGELLRVAGCALFFRSGEGRFHARLAIGERLEVLGLRSATFRDWLVGEYVREHRKLPSQRNVVRVLQALEGKARFEADAPQVFVRVGSDPRDEGITGYLDLGDSRGHTIKFGALGWSIVERSSVHFKRPQGLLPLPMPSRDGSIELVRPFVNLSDSDFRLLIGWMAAAIRPVGPYPILIIHGEQGSAKSTLVKVIRELIDPQAAALLAEPRSTRDLMVAAVNGWLLAFDNVSVLPGWLSDSLCRLASGGGFASRALFSNDERSVLHAQRPVILNGIDEFVSKGDLADRGVFLQLPPITPDARREEAEFWTAFRELQPRILGGLLDAVVGGLRELPSVRPAALPRMADFARFGEAIGQAMGWPAGTFLSAYAENRRDATISTLDDSVFGTFLLERIAFWQSGQTKTASPSEWLKKFNESKEHKATKSARWPKTPSSLGNELRRLAPTLRDRGVAVSFGKNRNSRLITITREHGFDSAGATRQHTRAQGVNAGNATLPKNPAPHVSP
jgi:hypothetical protein